MSSYTAPRTIAKALRSHGVGCVQVVKLGVALAAFGILWHKTNIIVACLALAAFLWFRSRNPGERMDPKLQAIFDSTAKLLGIATEELDRKTKKRVPVPAERWVRFVDGGGIDLRFPASFEAAGNNVSRVREQVERALQTKFVATVSPGTIHLRPRPVLPTKVEFAPLVEQMRGQSITKLAFARTDRGIGVWDVIAAPHGLVSGATGSGKTVAMRSLIVSALANEWEVVGCDPKRVELLWMRGRERSTYASRLDEMANAIQNLRIEMMRRFDVMESGEPLRVRPLLLVVDEATSLLAQAKAADLPILDDLGEIARLGRKARVHLLIGMQRPDAGGNAGLPGELKRNLDFRLAVGPHDSTASRMILDSEAGTEIEPVPGRGVARTLGVISSVQCAYLPDPAESPEAVEAFLPPRVELVASATVQQDTPEAIEAAPAVDLVKSTSRKVRKTA